VGDLCSLAGHIDSLGVARRTRRTGLVDGTYTVDVDAYAVKNEA
jgi:hypothetical protein